MGRRKFSIEMASTRGLPLFITSTLLLLLFSCVFPVIISHSLFARAESSLFSEPLTAPIAEHIVAEVESFVATQFPSSSSEWSEEQRNKLVEAILAKGDGGGGGAELSFACWEKLPPTAATQTADGDESALVLVSTVREQQRRLVGVLRVDALVLRQAVTKGAAQPKQRPRLLHRLHSIAIANSSPLSHPSVDGGVDVANKKAAILRSLVEAARQRLSAMTDHAREEAIRVFEATRPLRRKSTKRKRTKQGEVEEQRPSQQSQPSNNEQPPPEVVDDPHASSTQNTPSAAAADKISMVDGSGGVASTAATPSSELYVATSELAAVGAFFALGFRLTTSTSSVSSTKGQEEEGKNGGDGGSGTTIRMEALDESARWAHLNHIHEELHRLEMTDAGDSRGWFTCEEAWLIPPPSSKNEDNPRTFTTKQKAHFVLKRSVNRPLPLAAGRLTPSEGRKGAVFPWPSLLYYFIQPVGAKELKGVNEVLSEIKLDRMGDATPLQYSAADIKGKGYRLALYYQGAPPTAPISVITAREGSMVGMDGHEQLIQHCAYIDAFATRAGHQGRGAGTTLLSTFINWLGGKYTVSNSDYDYSEDIRADSRILGLQRSLQQTKAVIGTSVGEEGGKNREDNFCTALEVDRQDPPAMRLYLAAGYRVVMLSHEHPSKEGVWIYDAVNDPEAVEAELCGEVEGYYAMGGDAEAKRKLVDGIPKQMVLLRRASLDAPPPNSFGEQSVCHPKL